MKRNDLMNKVRELVQREICKELNRQEKEIKFVKIDFVTYEGKLPSAIYDIEDWLMEGGK